MNFEPAILNHFLGSVRDVYGYDFSGYAEASLKRRIAHFMAGRGIGSLEKLSDTLLTEETLFEEFVQEFSVTVTEMFRDPAFYHSLRKNVTGRLATYPFIKIWIAGCATGEEIYSLAILLQEENLLERSLLYATDINQRSLQVARNGIYPLERMKTYTENYQQAGGKKPFSEYYTSRFDLVIFNQSLKQNIVFASHNLAADKSFNEFQLIICRNVLIYFKQRLQNRVIGLFYESLCPFGFLGLGSKESLLFSDRQKEFEEVDRKEKIFIKKQYA